jgi:Cu/Ag efflux pump CusA
MVSSVRAVVDGYPGLEGAVLTYPKQRIAEVLDPKNRPLTVRVYGQDPAVLRSKATEVQRTLAHINGVAKPTVQVPVAEPAFQVEVNLAAAQQAGIKPGDVRRAEATVLSGLAVGALFQDQRVFDVVVKGVPRTRNSLTDVRNLLIDTPGGGTVHLGQVAAVSVAPTESEIRHEDVSRFVDVGADVHGRNVASVARDVNDRLKGISFPLEYHAQVLGDYAEGHAAHLRFIEVLLGAAAGILLLLQAAFGSWRLAFLVFLTLPLALTGGLLATWADSGTISVGSMVGFFAVYAIAARGCVMLIDRYQLLAAEQAVISLSEVVLRGTRERLVPIVVAAIGAALVLLPLVLFGHNPGFEIAHPMAVVVLGGVVSSTLFSLFVIPALYARFGPRPESRFAALTTTEVAGDGHPGRAVDERTAATDVEEVFDAAQ